MLFCPPQTREAISLDVISAHCLSTRAALFPHPFYHGCLWQQARLFPHFLVFLFFQPNVSPESNGEGWLRPYRPSGWVENGSICAIAHKCRRKEEETLVLSLSQTGTDVYFRSISSTSIVLGGGKEEWPFSVLVRKPMPAIPISFLLARILLSESRRVRF